MDLSALRFERDAQLTVLPGDLAVLLVGIAARQATSPTALLQGRIARVPLAHSLMAPVHGAFSAGMAAALRQWKGG